MFTAWNARPTLNRLVDDVVRDVAGPAVGMATTTSTFDAPFDVRASEDEIVLECDVPGVSLDDLEITLEQNRLSVRGERRYRGNDNERVLLGRRYGAFRRSFTLPDQVEGEKLVASLSDGVLSIHVPKRPEAKPRKIPIQDGGSKRLTEG